MIYSLQSTWTEIVEAFFEEAVLKTGQLLVIGCSTSEVAGERIGTAGTEEIAAALYTPIAQICQQKGVHAAFQCCEHLNRALVVERETMERYTLEEVSVIPVRKAGGAMATYAYTHLKDPVVVERIQAHAGLDVGDTLIGMHLRPVAVPVRMQVNTVGHAHVTFAKTRPKLIGGERAVYTVGVRPPLR
ncbi:TIGR01440 family protein [Bacillus fonticola]|uniref:TIGR01440 family protein n=1 Tax=Bacillus fonticola TaxID=2728853 RepID=UPI0014738138